MEKLRASDYRFIAICMLLLAGTAWYTAGNFYRAFPEASIDFRVNRDEARELARQFLLAQGDNSAGYRDAASFAYDDEAKTFLEREAGLERANQILSTRVRLWRWAYRWYRPQQKEEFRASVTPGGEVAGFSHEIAEDAARPAITAEQARALAETFLNTRMRVDPATLDFVETSSETRPNRVDRTFTWKVRDFEVHEATYRVEVTLLGNEVGGYHEYLKVPEQWTRDYKKLRSKNDMAQTFDTAAMAALLVGLLITIVMRVRRLDIRWRLAAMIGFTGMILSFCASMNSFPLQEFDYPTTDSYESFLTRQILQALLGALAAGGFLFVLAAGAEPLYRAAFPGKVSLGHLFSSNGLRTKRFFLGAILGVTLTSIFICYQTAFYITAYHFGAWSPADVPYDDLLNTRFPWLFVLFGGFFPAISEEFLFRMFAIPFLRKLTKSTVIAVIVAAYVWGFGHAGYAQQPFYIRGLEVGTGGVALGIIMLRWGILPTLVWHYSVDAMYSAMLLLRSHNMYLRLSGAASAGVVVLPVLVALIAYWRKGGFVPATGLLNADEPTAVEPPADQQAELQVTGPAAVSYLPLSGPARSRALVILFMGLLALRLPVAHFGEWPKYKLTAADALAKTDAFLRSAALQMEPSKFLHVTYPDAHWGGQDSLAGKYMLERKPVSFVSSMFERYRPIQHWVTRYFKSLDQEEVSVSVHPETGTPGGFILTWPEDRAGAYLTDDAARTLAAAFAQAHGQDTTAMDLKESSTEKRKARSDHTLVWEARAGDGRNLDEARYRVEVNVAGDRVSGWRVYWKLPEAFDRARSRQNFWPIAITVAQIVCITGLVVWSLLVLIGNIRQGLVRWRPALIIGGIAAALIVLSQLLARDQLLKNYPTAVPIETFQVMQYVLLATALIFGVILMAAAAALLISNFPDCLAAWRVPNRRKLGVDAAVALLAAIGFGILINRLEGFLTDRFHAQALFAIGSPESIVSAAPALSALAESFRGALLSCAGAAAVALLVRKLKLWTVPVVLVALAAMVPNAARTAPEFALYYGIALLIVSFVALWCWRFARNNYLAYALAFWVMELQGSISSLLGTEIPAMQVQGWVLAGIAVAGAVWVVLPGFVGHSRRTPPVLRST
jgi:membrane protease YdiL (CAAX protease family)